MLAEHKELMDQQQRTYLFSIIAVARVSAFVPAPAPVPQGNVMSGQTMDFVTGPYTQGKSAPCRMRGLS